MGVDRIERVNALIRRELGEAMFRLITDSRFDRSSVTVTSVSTSRNLRTANVQISIRGDEQHQQQMLSIIRRYRNELQKTINHDLKIKYTPVLHFELDPSIQKGDHVLDILSKLEHEADNDTDADTHEPNA
jgi:ribosome-binding factor A